MHTVCYTLLYPLLYLSRFNRYFYFWEISADWQIIKNCVILHLLRMKCFTHFSWNFPVSFGTGIFLFRSWTYWRCHVENVSGLIDTAVIPIFDFPCVPLASIDSSIGITFFKGLLFKNQFFYWFNVNIIWWQFYFCNC